MVPIAAAPGPRVAQGRSLWNDDHAAPLSLRWVFDSKVFVFAALEGLNVEGLIVHQVVETVKAVVPGTLLSFKWRRCVRCCRTFEIRERHCQEDDDAQ